MTRIRGVTGFCAFSGAIPSARCLLRGKRSRLLVSEPSISWSLRPTTDAPPGEAFRQIILCHGTMLLLLSSSIASPSWTPSSADVSFHCCGAGSRSRYPCVGTLCSNSLIFLKFAPNREPWAPFLHQLPCPPPLVGCDFTAGLYGNGLMSLGTGTSGRAETSGDSEQSAEFRPCQRELVNI